MSDESSHTRVPSGRRSVKGMEEVSEFSPDFSKESSPESPPEERSAKISTSESFSFESWELQSNTLIPSTSSPKNEIRYGLLKEYENMSMSAPLTAYCPGSLTKSTRVNPIEKSLSVSCSLSYSLPSIIFNTEVSLPFKTVSSSASG